MTAVSDKPILELDRVEDWIAFLEGEPGPDGVRLRLRKKASKRPGITYAEALDEALCFGWIDGQAASLDGDYYLQVFTPRRPGSVWSKRNREHIKRLEAEGRMRPAGLEQVKLAKADGRWDAAYRQKDAPVPEDLKAALETRPEAAANFEKLNAQNRFAVIFRIESAKRDETRATRIRKFAEMLERGETPHPQKLR